MLVDSPQQTMQSDTADEMSDVRFVQTTRKAIINKLLKDGSTLPEDKADKVVLMQALDGLDNSAIKRMRLKSDNASNNANVANAAMIAALLTRVQGGNAKPTHASNREIPVLHLEHSSVTLVPGELDIGTRNLTFDEFNANFENENPGSLSGEQK